MLVVGRYLMPHFLSLFWLTPTFKYPENSERVKNNNMGHGACGQLQTTMRCFGRSIGKTSYTVQDSEWKKHTVHGRMIWLGKSLGMHWWVFLHLFIIIIPLDLQTSLEDDTGFLLWFLTVNNSHEDQYKQSVSLPLNNILYIETLLPQQSLLNM